MKNGVVLHICCRSGNKTSQNLPVMLCFLYMTGSRVSEFYLGSIMYSGTDPGGFLISERVCVTSLLIRTDRPEQIV